MKAIPSSGHIPLRRPNATGALGAARATDTIVILRPAVDIVEGLTVIHGDAVELRYRQI